jgi:hypothetical protein
MEKTLIVIYEVDQVGVLKRYFGRLSQEERDAALIVTVGADIEFLLEKEGLPFMSGKNLRTLPHKELILTSERLGREILDDHTFSFFSYRDTLLSNVYVVALQNYLQCLLYFVDVMTTLAEVHGEYKTWILFPTTKIAYSTGGTFVEHEIHAPLRAARFVSGSYGVTVQTPLPSPTVTTIKNQIKEKQFVIKRFLFEKLLSVWNLYATYGIPSRDFSMLISDMWKNTGALMERLPECELILLDRAEAFKIGLTSIVKHRIRFVHLENFISAEARQRINVYKEGLSRHFAEVEENNKPFKDAVFRNHKLSELLRPALLDMIFHAGDRAVVQIEGAHALIEKMKPDIVWVRASISAQTHFSILCLVAKQHATPSIEVQHGILYLGPCALTNRPAVEYIATYGPLTTEELKSCGYSDKNLPPIGSPRFDVYGSIKPRRDRAKGDQFVVACVAPALLPYSWSDSYEIVEYYKHLAQAMAPLANVEVVIKLRPMSADESFFKEAIERAFTGISYRIAQWESMASVMESADAIIAIYSTTVLEGLISSRPVIYDGFMSMHQILGEELVAYESAGALVRVTTTEALAETLGRYASQSNDVGEQVASAQSFMKEHYSFDGDASDRLANFLRTLAKG